MKTYRPGDSLPAADSVSLFLAGPTSRTTSFTEWRVEALHLLEESGYNGNVFTPEPSPRNQYLAQVSWEKQGLESASLILFWVPRDLESLPGFTTNVEFGRYVDSGRVIYGRPDQAPKTRYLDWMYHDITGETPCSSLPSLIQIAIARLLTERVQA